MDTPFLDHLCQSIFNLFPKNLLPTSWEASSSKIKQQIKDVLAQNLTQLNLVSREEFDVQSKVLQRTRQKLELLEAKVKELEQAQH